MDNSVQLTSLLFMCRVNGYKASFVLKIPMERTAAKHTRRQGMEGDIEIDLS
jgi:hypothetical protein